MKLTQSTVQGRSGKIINSLKDNSDKTPILIRVNEVKFRKVGDKKVISFRSVFLAWASWPGVPGTPFEVFGLLSVIYRPQSLGNFLFLRA